MKLQLQIVYDRMKLQLQMFVQDRVDETTATNVCIYRVDEYATNVCQDIWVDETTATNVCI